MLTVLSCLPSASEEQTEADKTSERAEALPDDLEVEEEGEGEEEGEEVSKWSVSTVRCVVWVVSGV